MVPSYEIRQGHSLELLRAMPDKSVHCNVSSPPHWSLRDYQVSGQLGLERTPEEYVRNMVAIYREVHRVLRDDGTCWLNIGETRQQAKGKSGGFDPKNPARRQRSMPNDVAVNGLKAKDIVGIPWMLAFALRADGWYLRDCIIWHKPNAMPESVRDRTSLGHEYIFLLTKSKRYYFDQVAISEPVSSKTLSVNTTPRKETDTESRGSRVNQWMEENGGRYTPETRNSRSVWRIATKAYKGAHFATFPPEIPSRCISAGTSEAGVCAECGSPHLRIIEKSRKPTRTGTNTKLPAGWQSGPGAHDGLVGRYKHDEGYESGAIPSGHPTEFGNRDPLRHITVKKTVG